MDYYHTFLCFFFRMLFYLICILINNNMFYLFYFYILSEIINQCTIYTALYAKMLLTYTFWQKNSSIVTLLWYNILNISFYARNALMNMHLLEFLDTDCMHLFFFFTFLINKIFITEMFSLIFRTLLIFRISIFLHTGWFTFASVGCFFTILFTTNPIQWFSRYFSARDLG